MLKEAQRSGDTAKICMELPNPPHRPQTMKSKIAPDEQWNVIVRNITTNFLESVLSFLLSPEKRSTYEVPTSPDKAPTVNNGAQTRGSSPGPLRWRFPGELFSPDTPSASLWL